MFLGTALSNSTDLIVQASECINTLILSQEIVAPSKRFQNAEMSPILRVKTTTTATTNFVLKRFKSITIKLFH